MFTVDPGGMQVKVMWWLASFWKSIGLGNTFTGHWVKVGVAVGRGVLVIVGELVMVGVKVIVGVKVMVGVHVAVQVLVLVVV
jgi:hypothetical protein